MSRVVGLVLYEAAAEESLARWVYEEVLQGGMADRLQDVLYRGVSDAGAEARGAMVRVTRQAMTDYLHAHPGSTGDAADCVFLVIAIFWDGQSESSKEAFAHLRQFAEEYATANSNRPRAAAASAGAGDDNDHTTSSAGPVPQVKVHVLVQALNAKKGQHTIKQSQAALISSLRKKLDTVAGPSSHGRSAHHDPNAVTTTTVASTSHGSRGGRSSNDNALPSDAQGAAAGQDGAANAHSNDGNGAAHPSSPLAAPQDLSPAAIDHAVDEGQGECFFVLSADSAANLSLRLAELTASCARCEVGLSPVLPEPRIVAANNNNNNNNSNNNNNATSKATAASPSTAADRHPAAPPSSSSAGSSGGALYVQEFLLRRGKAGHHMELRLAMCGNVDSGKSTLTSVLTRGCHDDGRGFARAFVFNHKHEAATGRTSSISENHLGFTASGQVANYLVGTTNNNSSNNNSGGSSSGKTGVSASVRQFTTQELAQRSAKVFTLYDLAGHEKYLKTTVLGMTRNMPDYACIVISANNGIQRMTKEHIALCLALKLPFFIVITRIDATPENVFAETKSNIHHLLKIPTLRKLPYPVRRPEELVLAAKNLRNDRITPIFEVSNVTGQGIAELLRFLNLLPMRKDWRHARDLPREMIVDSTFFVTGVGTVVGGVVTQGIFRVNDTVLLGPDGFGHFRPVTIRSIHVKGVDSTQAEAGNDAAFCLKKERRSAIRKGNVLVDPLFPPKAYWQFEAEVTVLYHSTTISVHYEPVIHSNTVRQTARITYVAKDVLRTGDRSLVRFHFLYRPEFMLNGQRIIFREGRTKGIGVVTQLIEPADEKLLNSSKTRKKQAVAAALGVPPATAAPADTSKTRA